MFCSACAYRCKPAIKILFKRSGCLYLCIFTVNFQCVCTQTHVKGTGFITIMHMSFAPPGRYISYCFLTAAKMVIASCKPSDLEN